MQKFKRVLGQFLRTKEGFSGGTFFFFFFVPLVLLDVS